MNLKNIFSEYYDQSSILVLVHFTNIALNLLITVAHNCHIKTKCSHQIQITHSKFKLLTANYKSTTANYKSFISNTNRSHQIQIVHIKYKSLTSNTNRSHQIQIAHIKYKSLTANRSQQIQIPHSNCTKTVSAKGRLRTADCGKTGLRTADCGLQTSDQGKKQTKGKMQTAD